MVELSALARGLHVEDEGSSGFHPELLSKTGGGGGDMQTGRGASLRKETKIFMYSLNQYLLSPYEELHTVPSLRDTTVNKLGPTLAHREVPF